MADIERLGSPTERLREPQDRGDAELIALGAELERRWALERREEKESDSYDAMVAAGWFPAPRAET